MMIHLVCYADERYRNAQKRLIESALRHGVDQIHSFSTADLRRTDFYAEHRTTLDMPRGAGYWLWKPYYILRVLNEVKTGDFVWYMDCGAELMGPVDQLADLCLSDGGLLLFRHHTCKNKYWTKRDCFVLMGCDSEKYYEADQVNAAFCGFVAGPTAAQFVEEWLWHCTDPRKLTDMASECSSPELPEYLEHRHDQSICALLAASQDRRLYRDPSQTGNHRKLPSLRVPNEYLSMPYTSDPCDRSPYPTLVSHHRERATRPSAVGLAVTWAKAIIRQSLPKEWPNPYFEPADLRQAIQRNRETLAEVEDWFDPAADARSDFGYGVPGASRRLLSLPVGSQPTLPDLIGHLAGALGDELNYLEIGVSVGKNFYQLMRAGSRRTLTGFDIEEIHPNLSSRLALVSRTEWMPSPNTLKRSAPSLSQYTDRIGGNRIWYVAGDVFDDSCWARLEGAKFNFIFSDAFHRPEGLMYEWRMIERYDLLDRDEFVMVWDDLGGIMSLAFDRIAAEMETETTSCLKLGLMMRGWMGVNEHPHHVGLLAKLRNPPRWLGRLAERHAVASAQCS